MKRRIEQNEFVCDRKSIISVFYMKWWSILDYLFHHCDNHGQHWALNTLWMSGTWDSSHQLPEGNSWYQGASDGIWNQRRKSPLWCCWALHSWCSPFMITNYIEICINQVHNYFKQFCTYSLVSSFGGGCNYVIFYKGLRIFLLNIFLLNIFLNLITRTCYFIICSLCLTNKQ